MNDFNLAEVFAEFSSDPERLIDDSSLPSSDPYECLDTLIDQLAVSPNNITESDNENTLAYCINSFQDLNEKSRERLLDIIVSGMQHQINSVSDLQPGDSSLQELKSLVERYSFYLHWYLINLEKTSFKNQMMVHRAPGTNARQKPSAEFAYAIQLVLTSLESACSMLKQTNLGVMLATSSELDLFMSMFLKPVYLLMENEQLMKNAPARMHMFKAICLTVKSHQQQSNVQTSLMQLLIYFEHLSEPLAELLQILYEQFDHVNTTEEMLKEISMKSFNNNDTKGPKFISAFIIKLSQLIPQLMMKKSMTMVVQLLESESFTLRCAIIESCGNIIVYMARTIAAEGDSSSDRGDDGDGDELRRKQFYGLIDLVEERVLDVNPYARCRSLQVLTTLCEMEQKFTSRRPRITNIAVQCLKDKSSLVRRNAIKLLTRLVSTHPFGLLHGTQLALSIWQERLNQANAEIDKIVPAAGEESILVDQALDAPSDNEEDEDDREEKQKTADKKTEMINRLKLTRKYYVEAIEFIEQIHDALDQTQSLLFSKNKNEIIDAMDFFVLADAYGIEPAKFGIRKMIHLVWAKANNDEGQAIQAHLVECYHSLFFDTPSGISEADANLLVARNLISLTYGATLAELASLEHLLNLAHAAQRKKNTVGRTFVNAGVIKMLWKIYGYEQREISKSQRRGAVIIIGMLARADYTVANAGVELLLRIGLGEKGKQDLGLAKYTCIALQRCIQNKSDNAAKFPKEHETISKLCEFLLMPYSSMEWFGVAEQALKAINELCNEPTEVFTALIRRKTREVFGNQDSESSDQQSGLSQLLFLAGDIALKTIVHLELCEAAFKRKKIELEKENAKKKKDAAEEDTADDDLEMVGGGTTEDDFTDAIAYIRERELLFGEQSLLARFGPMAAEICKQGLRSPQRDHVSIASVSCLSKFMCVSATYCEDNLPILMTLLERAENSTIRSNCVLALGDIAVCFNHILDDNTDFLYRRLHDKYPVVQRTCLMTLTFLILAGQVKVKGQLGEMAKCLEDPDQRIADLSRMFFTELATKDNAIYNGFIDMFSVLSTDAKLPQEALYKILKYLASFIDKEKQIKQLADKLHARMARCDSSKAWNDLAYVLGILPHKNEDIVNTISQGYKYVPVRAD
ncbi:condensin complex subunit 1 [Trichomonascus vanleenenianus]|uniref:condensin subunit YCS4 n=1 Tax=Trichomonascus vanleenenianus TaxID=2268995 RepID=UPI003EC97BB4